MINVVFNGRQTGTIALEREASLLAAASSGSIPSTIAAAATAVAAPA